MNAIPINSIHFSKLEKKNDKYNIINLTTDNNKRLYLNLPKLECKYGITKYNNNNTEKYSLNLSINNDNNMFNFLENLDDLVNDNFLENKQWLEKLNLNINATKNQIKSCGNNLINKQPGYSSYINLKLIFNENGNFFCDIFKYENGQFIQLQNIKDVKKLLYKKVYVTSKIIISNVWIMDKKYGVTLKPKKLVFYS